MQSELVEKKTNNLSPVEQSDVRALVKAAHDLQRKLDLISKSKEFHSVFFSASSAGYDYKGETWGIELNLLKSVLKRFNVKP